MHSVGGQVPLHGTQELPGVVLLWLAAHLRGCRLAPPRAVKTRANRKGGTLPGVLSSALANSANDVLLRAGWETGAAVAVIVLEAMHPSFALA